MYFGGFDYFFYNFAISLTLYISYFDFFGTDVILYSSILLEPINKWYKKMEDFKGSKS